MFWEVLYVLCRHTSQLTSINSNILAWSLAKLFACFRIWMKCLQIGHLIDLILLCKYSCRTKKFFNFTTLSDKHRLTFTKQITLEIKIFRQLFVSCNRKVHRNSDGCFSHTLWNSTDTSVLKRLARYWQGWSKKDCHKKANLWRKLMWEVREDYKDSRGYYVLVQFVIKIGVGCWDTLFINQNNRQMCLCYQNIASMFLGPFLYKIVHLEYQ